MPKSWTCHWQYRYWRSDINKEFVAIDSSGNSMFLKRGVAPGDSLYVVSIDDGQLYLGGRMIVKQLVDRIQAVEILGTDSLHGAEVWAIDLEKSGTPLHLHRRLSPVVVKRITYLSPKDGLKGLCFDDDNNLNPQATRSVLELTCESVELLDRILELTDSMRSRTKLITVNDEMLNAAAK